MRIASTRRPLAGALGLLFAVAVVATCFASCFVGRKSPDFECSTTDDCDAGRTCDRGYCVVAQCPAACNNGCDTVAKTCKIVCDQPNKCNGTICPTGYACSIQCSGTNACDGTLCPPGAPSCDVTCSTPNACGNLRCGGANPCTFNCTATSACQDISCSTGRCDVKCTTATSCGAVNCSSSCACDVTCPQGACDTLTCPVRSGTMCTKTGTAGAECSSTFATACSSCP